MGLAAGFVDNCKDADLPQDKLRERIGDLLGRIDVDVDVNLKPAGGPVTLDLRVALRDDESFRAKVKKALASNRAVFRREIRRFFEDVVAAMPGVRTPVFIVDSIDHYRGRTDTFDEVRESVE